MPEEKAGYPMPDAGGARLRADGSPPQESGGAQNKPTGERMRIVLIALMLAGCSSLEQIVQEEPVEQGATQNLPSRKIADARRLCTKRYGYLPGSSAFEKCMEDNAPGMKAEVDKVVEKEEMIADAKAQCEKAGYPKNTDAYYECISNAMENALRVTAQKKQRR